MSKNVIEITVVFADGRFMSWNTLDERIATARLTAWLTIHPTASVGEPETFGYITKYRIKVP
jgi:hypothetical protein